MASIDEGLADTFIWRKDDDAAKACDKAVGLAKAGVLTIMIVAAAGFAVEAAAVDAASGIAKALLKSRTAAATSGGSILGALAANVSGP